MAYWSEQAISEALDGHKYALRYMNDGTPKVVDLYEPEELTDEHRPREWTPKELQTLYDCKRAGLPNDAISHKLGRPLPNVVIQWGRRWHWQHKIDTRPRPTATLEEIAKAVRGVYQVSLPEFRSPRRAQRIIQARQVFYWIARAFTSHSFPVIANYTGGKDHTTAMHGMRKIDQEFDQHRAAIQLICFDLGLDLESHRRDAA